MSISVEGSQTSIAAWIHENIYAGNAALRVGKISGGFSVVWEHYNPDAIIELNDRLSAKQPVFAYNVQDCTIGDDVFEVIE